MFRKQITQIMAAVMLFIASFVMVAPSPVYAQSHQGSSLSSRKCNAIKDKKKKKECEKKEKKEKKNDGINHDANDDNGSHTGAHN